MNRIRVAGLVIALALVVCPSTLVRAADSKDKLPAAKQDEKPAEVKPKPKVAEPSKREAGSDRFIDKDNNGVNDRKEPRVIRTDENKTPPAVKPEKQPQPAPKPPAAKAPPHRQG